MKTKALTISQKKLSQRRHHTAQLHHSTVGALYAVRALADPEFFATIENIRKKSSYQPIPYTGEPLKEYPDNLATATSVYRWFPRALFPYGMTRGGVSPPTPWHALLSVAYWHIFSLEDAHAIWQQHEANVPSPIMVEDPLPDLVLDLIKDVQSFLIAPSLVNREPEDWTDREMELAERGEQLHRFIGNPDAYRRHIQKQFTVGPRPPLLFLYPWQSADDAREAIQRFEMPRVERWTADDVWVAFIAYTSIAKKKELPLTN